MLNNSYTLSDIITIFRVHISGEEGVSRARMIAPPSFPFELSFLTKLEQGKRVCSIALKPFGIY